MLLAGFTEITLPLKNPVLQFSLILFIILFVPFFLGRFRIPSLISLILAGAVVGPHGLNLMLRDSSIVLFGTVGLLYIMFLAGLEIDVAEFKKNSGRSILFGVGTFLVSEILGVLVGLYILGFSMLSSVLVGSIFASHTLLLYPVISRLGIAKDQAVNIAVGGTLITDTMALLVLAVVVGSSNGELSAAFWARLLLGIMVFSLVVLLLFPMIARWFFKRFDDSVLQYLFVLGMVFLAAFLAETAGVEPIIGAFLGGLTLNRLIPHTSALMNRIKFVGDAIFIPFFLIGVGMLINFRAFFKDVATIKAAVVITVAATIAKYFSAWVTQKVYGFSLDQRRLIFGLISAHAGVAIATVLVGYNIIIGYAPGNEPLRLLDNSVLNGTILFILVTCTLATVIGEKGAQNIAFAERADEISDRESDDGAPERVLIPLNEPAAVEELVNLGITLKSPKSQEGLIALHIASNTPDDSGAEKKIEKLLEQATMVAAATDNELHGICRYDNSIVNGISGVVREQKATDLILGLYRKPGFTKSFLGNLSEMLLETSNVTTFVYRPVQPLGTIKRTMAVIPEGAVAEEGFLLWKKRLSSMVSNTGSKLLFYASKDTLAYLKEYHAESFPNAEYKVFRNLDAFSGLAKELRSDDNLVVVMSRRGYGSYHPRMAKIPYYLSRYFKKNSFILIYPVQAGAADVVPEFPEMPLSSSFGFNFKPVRLRVGSMLKNVPFLGRIPRHRNDNM